MADSYHRFAGHTNESGEVRMWKLLDIGCGGGGVSWGYHQAGQFEITGLDIADQPRYPFTYIKADMLEASLDGYDAYHLSAPCERWAQATLSQRRADPERYPDLITPMRPRLEATGKPFVIENVPQAPIRADLELCGCQFEGTEIPGIGQLQRLRAFELSWKPALPPREHDHHAPAISICGHGTPAWQRRVTGHVKVADWRKVMGIDWLRREELTEAVPPAYTRLIGGLLAAELEGEHCRHGVPITDRNAYNCWYYENPEHLKVDGPGQKWKAD